MTSKRFLTFVSGRTRWLNWDLGSDLWKCLLKSNHITFQALLQIYDFSDYAKTRALQGGRRKWLKKLQPGIPPTTFIRHGKSKLRLWQTHS